MSATVGNIYVQIIGEQAIKIEELRLKLADYVLAVDSIRKQLYCCAGPLNGNSYGYTNEQLGPFRYIETQVKELT